MRALIFLRLTGYQLFCSLCWPKRCHAFNSAGFNHKESFSSRLFAISPKECTRNDLRSEIQNFPGGGGMPPDPPSRRARSALYSRTGTLLFKILDPPLCSGLMRILYYMLILAISTHYCTTFQKQSHSLWSPQKNFVVDHTDTPRSWMLIQLQILWLCYSGFDLFRKIGYSGANGTPLMLVCS